jgi:glutamate decarboxylase
MDVFKKDGLTYAGVGWAIWRNKSFLPDDILFTVNYLGSPQVSFTLNFSKSGIHVIGQYYQLLRLGKSGFRSIVSPTFACIVAFVPELSLSDGKPY